MKLDSIWLFISWVCITFGVLIASYALYLRFKQNRRVAELAKQHRRHKEVSTFDSIFSPLSDLVEKRDIALPQRLKDAGIKHDSAAKWFNSVKYLVLAVGEIIIAVGVLYFELSSNTWVAFAALWTMVAIVVPDMWLNVSLANRQRRIARTLPYLVDLLAMCVQTDMSIEASLKYLAKEMQGFNPELGDLLDNTNQRARVVGMEKALEELYMQVPSPAMRSFMLTLCQSMQHGSSIYSMLITLAGDIRQVQILEIEEQIGKLAAKMSIPLIVFILMPLVFVITAPGVMRMMSHV